MGSHGAAVDRVPLADPVRGLLLVVSSTRAVRVERASAATLSDGWAARLGVELVRDDEALDAAGVGLGCFDLVALVPLEVVPAFDPDHPWIRVPVDPALRRWVGTRDPTRLPLPRGDGRPYHANLVVLPLRAGRARLSVGHLDAARSPPSAARPPRSAPRVGPWLAALADAPAASDVVLTETSRQVGGDRYPGFVAVRWMLGSRARMAFAAFPRAVTIEPPSLGGVPGTRALHDRRRDAIEAADVPWIDRPGQADAWSAAHPGARFGPRLTRWRAARTALLREDAGRFASAWAVEVGLLAAPP